VDDETTAAVQLLSWVRCTALVVKESIVCSRRLYTLVQNPQPISIGLGVDSASIDVTSA